MIEFIISLTKGFFLGFSVYSLSIFLDDYLSSNSKKKLLENDKELFKKAILANKINLLCISPLVYSFIDILFLNHDLLFSLFDYFILLLIHNLGYFFVHKEMHRNKILKKIHYFHHNFDKILIPSIGNAVSKSEFILAYVLPFILGSILIHPTEITFVSSIGTISILNMIIHTNEFKDTYWIFGFVSPKDHMQHHEIRNKNYSAPLVNLDLFLNSE